MKFCNDNQSQTGIQLKTIAVISDFSKRINDT